VPAFVHAKLKQFVTGDCQPGVPGQDCTTVAVAEAGVVAQLVTACGTLVSYENKLQTDPFGATQEPFMLPPFRSAMALPLRMGQVQDICG
jgi:hypothetical protein